MKKYLLLIFVLLVAITASYGRHTVYKTINKVTVYAEPSEDSEVLGTIDRGTHLNWEEFHREWLQIKYNHDDGYIISTDNIGIDMSKQYREEPEEVGFFGSIFRFIMNIIALALLIVPIYVIMRMPRFTNLQARVLSAVVPLGLSYLFLHILNFCGMYEDVTYRYIYGFIAVVVVYFFLTLNIDKRCAKCHYHEGVMVGGKRTLGKTYRVTDRDSMGKKRVSYETEATDHNHYQCPKCGYEWTVTEHFTYTGKR